MTAYRVTFWIALLLPAITYGKEITDIDNVHIRSLAASCAACHGTNGNTVHPAGKAPEGKATLAGMESSNITKQLMAFKSGERKSTVMHHHAKGLSTDEIEQLAAFFAAQKPQQSQPLNHQILEANHD